MSSDYGYDYLFKVIVIGNSGVGKSSMLLQFVDHCFTTSYISTIGVDFKLTTLDIDGKLVKLQIWDTAGQERFRTITSSYYRGAQAVMLVYDVTDRQSFSDIQSWLKEVNTYSSHDIIKLLVGNKNDIKDQREVDLDEGQDLATKYGMTFIETSAKDNKNIQQSFMKLGQSLIHKYVQTNISSNTTLKSTQTLSQTRSLLDSSNQKKACCN